MADRQVILLAAGESRRMGVPNKLLLEVGGVSTTLEATGQQWDAPNAWPPLQHMLVSGLRECGAPHGAALAAATK